MQAEIFKQDLLKWEDFENEGVQVIAADIPQPPPLPSAKYLLGQPLTSNAHYLFFDSKSLLYRGHWWSKATSSKEQKHSISFSKHKSGAT